MNPYSFGDDIFDPDADSEEDQLLLEMPYYALEFMPDSDPLADELFGADPERVFNHIGNAAGLASLGRAGIGLGVVGALGYGAWRLAHPKRGPFL